MQFLRGLSAFRLDIPAPSVTHRVHRFRGAVPSLPCDAAAASGPAEPKAARLHRIRTLHPMKNLLAGALALLGFLFLPAAARAGTFSTGAWTNDATTGISTGKTSWAFHFGAAAAATVNGVSVTGIASTNSSPYSRTEFDLAGLTSVFTADTNNVTGAGGSAVIAHDFVYGGNPGTLTVVRLDPGIGPSLVRRRQRE